MAKKSFFSRFSFRNFKKLSANHDDTESSDVNTPTSLSSPNPESENDQKAKSQDALLKTSQKHQHLLSLLKCSNPDEAFVWPDGLSPHQQSLYALRLYIATIQKLKRHQPFSMEKQRAFYHLLSCLVVQQELDRYEPDFDPIGRKPRKTRYISTLLDTPVECVAHHQHPVSTATKRKPFLETSHVIIPSPSLSSSLSSSSLSLKSSRSSTTTITVYPLLMSSSSSCSSFNTFPLYKYSRSKAIPFHGSDRSSSSSSSTLISCKSRFNVKHQHQHTDYINHHQLWSSHSDPHLSFSFRSSSPHILQLQPNSTDKMTYLTDDEDNVPLAILKTRKTDLISKSTSLCLD